MALHEQSKLLKFGMSLMVLLALAAIGQAQTWTPVDTAPNFNVGIALQLTDGTIMVQEQGTFNWWQLRPNKFGIYRSGSWHALAPFPAAWGYSPTYFASAVLKDGRVIIEGGEDNNGSQDWTTLGAIYDPVANTWTKVPPPPGWNHIGDAQSVVLPNGTFMMGNCGWTGSICSFPLKQAFLNEKTLTWTIVGSGKFDGNDEEGYTLLPNGKVLTIDTYLGVPYNPNGTNSEIFNPATKKWSSAGSTVQQLWDSRAACGISGLTNEVGPAILRPDGTVFAGGSNTCPGPVAGHTAIYNTATGTWSAGPDFLGGNDMADAPAAILPDGNVLIDTNPGWGNSPSTFYEFDGSSFTNVGAPSGINPSNTEGGRMLVTSTGSIMVTHVGFPQVWFYTTTGTYQNSWRPTICAGCYPPVAYVNKTYKVSGTQFNGLTQGSAFGDDAQSATNYPLVQITNNATGHKFFARTHGFSTMGVATGSTPTYTYFTILPTSAGTEFGDSTLVVIANGIPSEPVGIIIRD